MTTTLYRGRVLDFSDEPMDGESSGGFSYREDGAIAVENGMIIANGDYSSLRQQFAAATVVDHRPHLIMPGFIDTHIHFPQVQVTASYAGALLEWLNKYTFVEEQKFRDMSHAECMAKAYFDELVNHGTTTSVAYCSVHKESAEAFFAESARRNMRNAAGKVMMDRNAPPGLLDTAQSGYDDTKALIEKWHGRGRQVYAISPRFAITSTPAQLEASGQLLREHPDCLMQTHLSENKEEIAFTMELYPEAKDYTDVYAKYGLLGRKSLFGHCIHLSEREASAMSESGSVAVFCPTSNLFIGSGLFDMAWLRSANVRVAVATDIGGGTSYSMLRTFDEAYKILNLQGQRYHPLRSFYQMTLGNARALSMEDKIGTLRVGTEADFVVLNASATSSMRLRMETVTSLSEELFVLQTMGDDRAIAQTYVAGYPQKTHSTS
ncbi:MAG: guanine deaminase [Rhizobiaceae bacterium]